MTVQILHGDCIAMMKKLPDESVDCCVTSPPYYGLRNYGVDGQHGMEKSLAAHIETMVAVFEEVRRVLKPTGTLWLNYGDCYASSVNGRSAADTKAAGGDDRTFRDKPFSTVQGVFKAKDLLMIPNRLAIALQEAGWWVRSEIIWGKPNPMPESIKDRPATSHEKIFLLSKSARYFYNPPRMPCAAASLERWEQDIENQEGSARANGGRKTNGNMKAVGCKKAPPGQRENTDARDKQAGHGRRHAGFNERWKNENANGFRGGSYVNGEPGPRTRTRTGNVEGDGTRNLRNYEPPCMQVWQMATVPCKFAHFATFPPELAERCIGAGCPPGGVVLDPYGGAGTTGLVAAQLGMSAILCELNEEYIEIATTRLRAGLVRVKSDIKKKHDLSGTMFEGLDPCS